MSKSFSYQPDLKSNLKRTSWDLSFQNNLTLDFGKLYPVFVKETIPGDSWNIKPTFGLNFMPFVFPVQTRMYAKIYFFYCRNRAVWPHWKEFITNVPTEDGILPEKPYLTNMSDSFFKIGSLADYMGIPTDSVSEFYSADARYYSVRGQNDESLINTYVAKWFENGTWHSVASNVYTDAQQNIFVPGTNSTAFRFPAWRVVDNSTSSPADFTRNNFGLYNINSNHVFDRYSIYKDVSPMEAESGHSYIVELPIATLGAGLTGLGERVYNDEPGQRMLYMLSFDSVALNPDDYEFSIPAIRYTGTLQEVTNAITFDVKSTVVDGTRHTTMTCYPPSSNGAVNMLDTVALFLQISYSDSPDYQMLRDVFLMPITTDVKIEVGSVDGDPLWRFGFTDLSTNPFVTGDIKLDALPFRHYESIYNSYFRRQQVDPFKIGDIPQYNRFNTNRDDGADSSTPLDFYSVNWEADAFTSAFLTPQADNAPLIGVNYAGRFKFENEQGETYYATPVIDEDGLITGISAVSDNFPESTLQRLQAAIVSGISINDIRNANSLQKYLEKNLFTGYRYRDLMRSHFGETIHFNELDMPEYIGGVSRVIDVSKVLNQTAGADDKALGEFAGLATVFGQSKHHIRCRCDEHGFIIGLMAVTPVPVYSQLLPKFYTKEHFLDYYTPEFYNIGLQPITYKEITPLEAFTAGGSERLNDVFGYQKAWYDYMMSYDEAHGLFRGNLKNYVMMRTFTSEPELGPDFLHIDRSKLNNVFASDGADDKIMGQIWFNVSCKRIVRRNVTPSI